MAKNTFHQGDIVLIPYSYDDLSSTKKRPIVIISHDGANPLKQGALRRLNDRIKQHISVF